MSYLTVIKIMTIDKTTVSVIMKGLACLGFVIFTIVFIGYLVTNMTLYGSPLSEGDKVINNRTIDLGTIELRDDNLNESGELLDEKIHQQESAEWLHNSAYIPNDNNTTCSPVYVIMKQWIPNKFECFNA